MSIKDSIDLFNSKIDKTYWTRQDVLPSGRIAKTVANPVVLPVENYYKVLQKKYVKVGDNSGSVPAFQTNNFAEYFANIKEEKSIAVVKSVKTVNSVPTKISIATYFDQNGDIAILNRFDQTGRPHDNYFEVYGSALSSSELDFYKKYLSDREFDDPVRGKHFQVFVPHIHFNTRSQTVAFGHHDKANAISLEKLMIYLNDLKHDSNPNSHINNIDMGMPFLDLKKVKLEYSSTMLSSVNKIIGYFDEMKRVSPDKFSDYEKETIDLMKSLINIDEDGLAVKSKSTINPDGTKSNKAIYVAQSRLSKNDILYIANKLPALDDLNASELIEIKKYISKIIRDIEKERKTDYNRIDNHKQEYEHREKLSIYKDYLKYVKGLLNVESMLVDIKKYMQIYNVLNERDPMLMSVISNQLLTNLTINIKPLNENERGEYCYEEKDREFN